MSGDFFLNKFTHFSDVVSRTLSHLLSRDIKVYTIFKFFKHHLKSFLCAHVLLFPFLCMLSFQVSEG